MLASMRSAHDEVDPWAEPLEVVELGNDLLPSPPSHTHIDNIDKPHPKRYRTGPLSPLPVSNTTNDCVNGDGPRRRPNTSPAQDSTEPYPSAATSAFSSSSQQSTSHPLEVDASFKTSSDNGRARSSSGPSPLSPLSATLSPHSASSPTARRSPHALTGLGGLGGTPLSDFRDVSRPGLARATSETERAASVGSWSATNSDFGEDDSELVDVIVHSVTPSESIAGIALRYGIELPALRRANKLWPSDPLLRSQLFVPLDNCKATADSWIEVDNEGASAVLVRRKRRRDSAASGAQSPASVLNSEPSTPRGEPPRLPDTPGSPKQGEVERVVLEVARVPASQLRFFPHKPNRGRSSFEDRLVESPRRRRGLFAALTLGSDADDEYEPRAPNRVTVRSGAWAEPSSSKEPKHKDKEKDKDKDKDKRKTKMVRLRPPAAQAPPPPNAGIASRLQSFFSVPPPPAHITPPVLPPVLPPTRNGQWGEAPGL
ncbi:hypothetical protein CspeluHIS016_0309450 [Cutaneotrichosporon spelunceum]|uniref:LysM domain-containing protein n=1 Tax=Cutaneotrichosporon spelunceum TaxID=1672016 RepID=A0AAD3TUE5_9TREE|nr:hypothetical protein CspeluHIS016_0309450 [Cutaneotrichosporon spelunceum]